MLERPEDWVPETGVIDKATLLRLARYAAEYGDEVYYNGRRIYPAKIPPLVRMKTEKEKRLAVPGVTFTPDTRIGDEARDGYLDHLSAMLAGGHVDQAEYDARMSAVLNSRTEEELKYLVSDLPPMVVPAAEEKKEPPSLLLPIIGLVQSGLLAHLLRHPLPLPVLAVLACCMIFWGVVLIIAISVRIG